MSDLIVRTLLSFAFEDDDTKWFADKTRVTALIAAITSTDLGPVLTHAGRYGEQRPAKGAAAIGKAIANGRSGSFLILDAAQETTAKIHIAIDIDTDSLDVTLMLKGAALASRRGTALDTLESIGIGLFEVMRDVAALSKGFTHPMSERVYAYPRVRPPATHPRFETTAVIDFIDQRAEDPESTAMARATTPAYVKRSTKDDLIVLRWIASIEDEEALALAAGRHERWLSKTITLRPTGEPGAGGDALVPLSRKAVRPPFTFFDPDQGFAYKAIVVDRTGVADAEVWADMTKALAKKGADIKGIRLIAPLRDLAIKLAPKAKTAGFDAVLYPDETDHLRNPAGGHGQWIDEVDPE